MSKKHGFTLIELLSVVMILAILTAVAVPQYRKSIQRAEAANALINLKTMFDAAKRSYAYHSQWPSSLTGLDVEFLDISSNGEVDEFKYTLSPANKTAAACRLKGNSAANTYCLTAYYKKNNVRDVYTCQDNSGGKYVSVCDSLCPADYSNGECVIE